MSDRGIPRSYRTMEGFGVHTFRLVNADGATSLVKFHWKPVAGVRSLVWEEAQIAAGVDPDFHRRDMADGIEAGAFLEFELGIQVMPDDGTDSFEGIDLLDPTKLVPEELAPVQLIGKLTLNRRPGCSPTSTPSSPTWADRTSRRCRSTAPMPRSTTCCVTVCIRPRCSTAV
jgi:catalase